MTRADSLSFAIGLSKARSSIQRPFHNFDASDGSASCSESGAGVGATAHLMRGPALALRVDRAATW
jgi:hypothetical protein